MSLDSHAIFHYYKYIPEDDSAASKATDAPSDAGRVVDPTPVLSVLLEPRSVIITTASLYTSHLHGIQEVEEDNIVTSGDGQVPLVGGLGTPIANWGMLLNETKSSVMRSGGVLTRGTRYSLTCRDVEKVASGTSFLRR